MKTINKTQQGFTLVELIIVIVILGILAVTAAPRFLNFSGDAKLSVLNSIKSSIESANSVVRGKATIAGLQGRALSCYSADAVIVSSTTPATDTTNTTANGTEGTTPVTNCDAGVDLVYGAMDAEVDTLEAFIETGDFFLADATVDTDVVPAVAAKSIRIALTERDANTPTGIADGCFVLYTEPADATTPATIDVYTQSCD
jgi:MSHA pilin protein MshA